MTHIEQTIYGRVTKKNLLWKANMIKEIFNNANFKSKRSVGKQIINYVICYCIFVLKRIKTILVFQILL